MVLYFADGCLREIKNWGACEVYLGIDWVAATKASINEAANGSR
jgi:hypothetical protein